MKPTPGNPWAQQNEAEFRSWLRFVKGHSLLEVGSCYGHALMMMAAQIDSPGRVVSVDLGRGVGAIEGEDTGAVLRDAVASLRRTHLLNGYLLLGDSHSPEVYHRALKHAPFDVGFIDGDHSYEGVKKDFETYGPACKVLGLHDIHYDRNNCGVPRFWREVKASGRQYVEIGGGGYGIGVVFNP